jgi:hypothetical protein
MPTDSPKKILTDAEMEAIVTKHAQESNPYPEVARIAASHVAVSKALKSALSGAGNARRCRSGRDYSGKSAALSVDEKTD